MCQEKAGAGMLWVDVDACVDVCACTPASLPTRVSVCFMVCNGKEAGGVCMFSMQPHKRHD